jgi:hypothetical protein
MEFKKNLLMRGGAQPEDELVEQIGKTSLDKVPVSGKAGKIEQVNDLVCEL